jgi:predicted MFS family arabinose efflux permease
MATGASLPFACAWLGSNVFAWVLDRTGARRAMLVPYGVAAVCVLLVPTARSAGVAIALVCAAMALFTAATPIFASASLRLAPEHAGVLAGVQNAFANLAGVVAPAATGWMAANLGWDSVFWATAAVAGIGAAAYGWSTRVGPADP